MKQITENTILLVLLLIGGLGLLMHYNDGASTSQDDFEIVLSQNGLFDASSHEKNTNRSMKITGTPEVGFPLSFEITNFRSDSRYFLEMGNGERYELTGKSSNYIYEQPGSYHVNLIAVNGKHREVIHSVGLNITQHLASFQAGEQDN